MSLSLDDHSMMTSHMFVNPATHLMTSEWEEKLCQQLYDLYQNDIGCDVTIYCADGGRLEAHAVVLMTSSLKLKQLILAGSSPGQYTLEVKSIGVATWRTILDFIYLGKTTFERSDEVEVGEAATAIGIHALARKCFGKLRRPRQEESPNSSFEDQPLDLTKPGKGKNFTHNHVRIN